MMAMSFKFAPTTRVILFYLMSIFFSFFTSRAYSDNLSSSNYGIPTTRSYTLRTGIPFPTELEYHRLTISDSAQSYCLPRSVTHEVDQSLAPLAPASWPYGVYIGSEKNNYSLSLNPVVGFENRREKQVKSKPTDSEPYIPTSAVDIGITAFGHKGPIGFYLDGRIYTEMRDTLVGYGRAFDREFLETQDDEHSDGINYTSYARYRSQVSLDLSWGRWLVAHDTPHWGPGLYTNLVFHEDGIPFDFIEYSAVLGPFRIVTMYGRLQLENMTRHQKNDDTRSVYAHRYEWSVVPDVLVGISEQLIIYNWEEPWAFAPVVPLFMHKGLSKEHNNNGNISFDASWRIAQTARVYTEFLVDDLQAPSALFNDYWGNRWAWMTGFSVAKNIADHWQVGFIGEYSRVEPFVYMHYDSSSSQSANAGYPLGNQLGPNSQWIAAKAYTRWSNLVYTGLKMDLQWKGKDFGSDITVPLRDIDGTELENIHKIFIDGIDRPKVAISPILGINYRSFSLQSSVIVGTDYGWNVRLQLN